jgi:N-sulfoglucosamine sulfohydrolase
MRFGLQSNTGATRMDLNRRTFMKSAAAASAAGLLQSANGQAAEKRNVVLFVTDDQGMRHAGCYGADWLTTPGFDRVAANGVRMNYAFCTTPSCSPSRSVILSGLHNHANGMYGLAHATHHFQSFDNVEGLPVLLGKAGYRTISAGKYHVNPEASYKFDHRIGGKSPMDMAQQCRPHIESDSGDPFFLYFCTSEPHRPFRREGIDPVSPNDVVVPDYLPDIPECREELAQYAMSLERADQALDAILDMLEETGHWDDTLVIAISDNGIAFPGAKTCMYEPGVNLPCVIRNPLGEARNAECNAMVTWADLAPTILDYAGVEYGPKQFNGRSFLNAIEQADPSGWDEVYLSHQLHEITMYYPVRVVRERRYKLMWNIAHGLPFPFAQDLHRSSTWQAVKRDGLETYGKREVEKFIHRDEYELYDLENDPDELNNLANDAEHAETLARLLSKLKTFQEETKDPWLHKWEYE